MRYLIYSSSYGVWNGRKRYPGRFQFKKDFVCAKTFYSKQECELNLEYCKKINSDCVVISEKDYFGV